MRPTFYIVAMQGQPGQTGGGPVCVERVGALAKVEIGIETRSSR